MFEFENSTYSGMLTILSCLFGIAYPLLLTSIERIDSKYKSTLLIRRFKTEKVAYLHSSVDVVIQRCSIACT